MKTNTMLLLGGAVAAGAFLLLKGGVGGWSPWVYDVNKDGIIDINELLTAGSDYFAGIITQAQLDQVTALYGR